MPNRNLSNQTNNPKRSTCSRHHNNLKMGDTIIVKNITPAEGVKVLGDPESIVFSVEHVKTIEEAVAAAPVEGESTEPELIREKKEKEETEEEEKAEAPKAAEKKEEKK